MPLQPGSRSADADGSRANGRSPIPSHPRLTPPASPRDAPDQSPPPETLRRGLRFPLKTIAFRLEPPTAPRTIQGPTGTPAAVPTVRPPLAADTDSSRPNGRSPIPSHPRQTPPTSPRGASERSPPPQTLRRELRFSLKRNDFRSEQPPVPRTSRPRPEHRQSCRGPRPPTRQRGRLPRQRPESDPKPSPSGPADEPAGRSRPLPAAAGLAQGIAFLIENIQFSPRTTHWPPDILAPTETPVVTPTVPGLRAANADSSRASGRNSIPSPGQTPPTNPRDTPDRSPPPQTLRRGLRFPLKTIAFRSEPAPVPRTSKPRPEHRQPCRRPRDPDRPTWTAPAPAAGARGRALPARLHPRTRGTLPTAPRRSRACAGDCASC
jgi:hypothetical protein